ncbi:MAG TPA: selenocysteine-specific translation elongation factor [Vicinamibacterales bacterium]|jgi:selenocysteine-specific elongation factor
MKSIIVGTAGHIDHGKSSLVQALTGTDPDRLKEEKVRGITIDLGFAHVDIEDTHFAFVDVPGHERFVRNMLAGVGGIDLAVLVVAADESVMPQTREHFDICRLLKVSAGVVVLSKSDLAEPDTQELATLEIRDLVCGSFLESAPIVPVSARTGEGLDALRAALVEAGRQVPGRSTEGATRLPIDRVFSIKGFGTVVTGTLVSGSVAIDRDLVIAPGQRPVKVRGLQVHGQRVSQAVAGHRCAVNLAGLETHEVERGQTLITPGAFVDTRIADVEVEALDNGRPLRHGARVRFHQGTAEVIGRVGIIDVSATEIAPGGRGFARLRLEAPIVLSRGDRFILRAYSPPRTIAGGVVLDPAPPSDRIRLATARERCRALAIAPHNGASDDDFSAARALIADAGATGLPVPSLASRIGIDPRNLESYVNRLVAGGVAASADGVLVEPSVLAHLKASVVATLTAHHRSSPLSEGIPREELRRHSFPRGHQAVFDRALADLAASNQVALRDRVALAGHQLSLSPAEARARDALNHAYRDAGLKPPETAGVAAVLGIDPAATDRMLKLLQRQNTLVRVGTLWFHESALHSLKDDVAAMKAAAHGPLTIDVATFKQRYGVSRKFAIPLLEYLDRERVTRRTGDSRLVL